MMTVINDIKADYEEQIKLNRETIHLNNEIMKQLPKSGVEQVTLSELNNRKQQRKQELRNLEKDIKLLKEQEEELLIKMKEKYQCQFDKLENQRNLLDEEMRQLQEYQSKKNRIRKSQEEFTDIEKKTLKLEEDLKKLRYKHCKLFNECEIFRKQIKHLDELIGKQNHLRLKIESDGDLSALMLESVKQIEYDDGQKTISREA